MYSLQHCRSHCEHLLFLKLLCNQLKADRHAMDVVRLIYWTLVCGFFAGRASRTIVIYILTYIAQMGIIGWYPILFLVCNHAGGEGNGGVIYDVKHAGVADIFKPAMLYTCIWGSRACSNLVCEGYDRMQCETYTKLRPSRHTTSTVQGTVFEARNAQDAAATFHVFLAQSLPHTCTFRGGMVLQSAPAKLSRSCHRRPRTFCPWRNVSRMLRTSPTYSPKSQQLWHAMQGSIEPFRGLPFPTSPPSPSKLALREG